MAQLLLKERSPTGQTHGPFRSIDEVRDAVATLCPGQSQDEDGVAGWDVEARRCAKEAA